MTALEPAQVNAPEGRSSIGDDLSFLGRCRLRLRPLRLTRRGLEGLLDRAVVLPEHVEVLDKNVPEFADQVTVPVEILESYVRC